jgi:adenylate kinase family enzyme
MQHMQRILIIGCGGSGKSTLARKLHDILNIELIHLDQLFWKPGWVETDDDAWKQIVENAIKKDAWIMDGNFNSTMDMRMARADTIIFLDMPRHVCLSRVLKRWFKSRVLRKPRPDMTEGCLERIDFAFLKWIWNYNKVKRPQYLEKMNKVKQEKKIIILSSQKEQDTFLDSLHPSKDRSLRSVHVTD